MEQKITLKVGETDLGKFGFDLGFQKLLRQELPKCFPSASRSTPASLVLELLKPGVSNLHWRLQHGVTEYFLKASFGRGDGPSKDRLAGEERARIRFQKTQPHGLLYEHVDVFSHKDRWIRVEVLNLMKGTPLDRLLDESLVLTDFPKSLSAGDLIIMGQNIAHSVHNVHSFQSSGEIIGAEEYQRFQLSTQREQMYAEALEDIVTRAEVYMPVDHPLLSKRERGRFLQAMERFRRSWTGGGDRLCLVHGDLQRGNIMTPPHPTSPEVLLIDFSPRVQIGERGWDDGRFVADLLQVYFETKDDRIKALINSFIVTSEVLSGDSLYWQGLVWGVFAMTLLKFWAKGRPITDREVAQRYFNNSLRIIEQGRFSWAQ